MLRLHMSDHELEVLGGMFDVHKDKAFDRDELASLSRELLGLYCMKTCDQVHDDVILAFKVEIAIPIAVEIMS